MTERVCSNIEIKHNVLSWQSMISNFIKKTFLRDQSKTDLSCSRHTDKLRSPAPDIKVLRRAFCYLLRSNSGLKNLRLFLQHLLKLYPW